MSKLEKNDVVVSVTRYASYVALVQQRVRGEALHHYKRIESLESSPELDFGKTSLS